MRIFYFLFFLGFLTGVTQLAAQPINDDCVNAIPITDELTNWCSDIAEYTNVTATPSGFGPASCWNATQNDVWFVFVPTALDVTITVIGDLPQSTAGTLNLPEVSLYTGDCNATIFEEECQSAAGNNNIVELYKGGLAIGTPHYIRVQGRNGNTGTFQLCINNFNPPVNPGSDCFTSSVLCNKDPFVVQQVTGSGSDPFEADDAPCLNGFGGTVESNSTWFTWTAANNGSLTFTLTPTNPEDDLDFVLYRLPNGVFDCSGKEVLRCMASGDTDANSPCMGPTGLSASATDISEPAGCQMSVPQDNFLQALDMVAGESYALIVNNFSASGNGFEMEFGGSGEFVGPETSFTATQSNTNDLTVCIGESLTFTDASTFNLGQITDWDWQFGQGASIQNASTQGPHEVSYDSPGTKLIALTVTTDRGCLDTEILEITVECCSDHFEISEDVSDVLCPDDPTGIIDVTVMNDYGPYVFIWDTGDMTEDISNIPAGDYSLTITDQVGCDSVITFTVESPDPLVVDPVITMPTCNGGTDGAIVLDVDGGVAPIEFNWQNTGFGADNTLNNLPVGDYDVVVRDANGCEVALTIEVRELELALDPVVEAITRPSCFGFNDGAIAVVIDNGQGPYQYNFNDGNGFVDENVLTELTAGTYTVDVRDANLCVGSFVFELIDFPPLEVNVVPQAISCSGANDGVALAEVTGGAGGYSYIWEDGDIDSLATELKPGSISVTVTDINGCEAVGTTEIIEPSNIELELIRTVDVICNGDSTGVLSVQAAGGTPPFEYSIDTLNFQSDTTFTNLLAGVYTVTARDSEGCTEQIEVEITQPEAFVVEALGDSPINLGFTSNLQAIANEIPTTLFWAPAETLSCDTCFNPVASPFRTTTYLVTAFNQDNCPAIDTIQIVVFETRPIFVPNIFSPNDDGINDKFTLFGGPAVDQIQSLRIFDRWGELIFEQEQFPISEESLGWDGTFNGEPVNPGVFVYMAEVSFIDGEVFIFEGDITVIR